MSDFEAYDPGTEPVNESDIHKRAFYEYLGGIIMDDISAVNEATRELENLGTPFAGELPRRAYMHECFQLEGATDSHTLEIMVGWSLRAYAYSGVPVDGDMTLMVANRAGISETELRGWLAPCSTLIDGVIDGYGKKGLDERDKAVLEWRGLQTLQSTGMDSFADKIRLARLGRTLR